MSITVWPLSKKTIKKAVDFWHTNPEPSGTEEFHYVCDGQDYFLYCPDAPDYVIKHFGKGHSGYYYYGSEELPDGRSLPFMRYTLHQIGRRYRLGLGGEY